jgi:D-alanyl-D-alanine carboxypeptidase (penicillin-binding protein 5/6)
MKKFISVLLLSIVSFISYAQPIPIPAVPAVPAIAADSYILVDFESGKVLQEKKSRTQVEPASITKMMTAYAVFSALKNGAIGIEDEVLISEKAWRMKGSRMFIEVNKKVKVSALLKGMIIQSGNDASIALAEYVAGNEDNFAIYMNELAKKIGMTSTNFVNATGWPAENHYTTAYDVALLAAALIREFPEEYKIFKVKKYTFNNISQSNRNKLLWHDKSVDGLKTGHTKAAGYCLASSAIRDGMRLISVIMGTKSEKARSKESQKLLGHGFRFYDSRKLYSAHESIDTIKIWKGEADSTDLVVKKDFFVVLPRGQEKLTKASVEAPPSINAPINTDSKVGDLVITHNGKEIARTAVYSSKNVKKGGLFKRGMDSIKMYFE